MRELSHGDTYLASLLRAAATGVAALVAVFVLCVQLAACATDHKLVDHAFSFDAWQDSPDVEILDYKYGARQPTDASRALARPPQFDNINGPFEVADTLFVRWQIKTSGEIREDTVNLRARLPNDMKNRRIHFVVRGAQLYVYLIGPERLPDGVERIGPSRYQHLRVRQIYPSSAPSAN